MAEAPSFGKMALAIKESISMAANTEKEHLHLFQRSVMSGNGQTASRTEKESSTTRSVKSRRKENGEMECIREMKKIDQLPL